MAEDPVLTPAGARLFEYFVSVSLQDDGKGKGGFIPSTSGEGGDSDGCYAPVVTDRWPPVDIAGAMPFPDGVAPFAFPRGARLAVGAGPPPKSHSFVTTAGDGSRVFGTALLFFEPIPNNSSISAPRAMMLLSRWPILTALRRVLAYLFRLSLSGPSRSAPLERALVALLALPAPPAGRAVVQATVGDEVFFLRRAAPNARTCAVNLHFALRLLSAALPPAALLRAWHALLLERSVVLVASSASALTPAALALTALLYPFKFRHVFVPLLPRDMGARDVLAAPVPFLIGIVRGSADDGGEAADIDSSSINASAPVLDDVPPGLWVVDLDAGTAGPKDGDDPDPLPPLPARAGAKLLAALTAAAALGSCTGAAWARGAWSRLDDAFFHAQRPTDDDECGGEARADAIALARAAADSPTGSDDEGFGGGGGRRGGSSDDDDNSNSPSTITATNNTRVSNLPLRLRRAFFRFFVATLKKPVIDGALAAGFDAHAGRIALLAAAPPDARPLLSALAETMMWKDLVCATVGGSDGMGAEAAAAARVDAAFFTEACAAKENRSALAGRVRARIPTPFLSDTRWAHTAIIAPPPPQRERLVNGGRGNGYGDDEKVYSYVPFPARLDAACWIDARCAERGDDCAPPPDLPQFLPFAKAALSLREAPSTPISATTTTPTTSPTAVAVDVIDLDKEAPLESWLIALEGALPTASRDAARAAAGDGPVAVATAKAAASTLILDSAWATARAAGGGGDEDDDRRRRF